MSFIVEAIVDFIGSFVADGLSAKARGRWGVAITTAIWLLFIAACLAVIFLT